MLFSKHCVLQSWRLKLGARGSGYQLAAGTRSSDRSIGMEQLRAALGSVAQLLGDGLLTPAEAAEMKAGAMQDFATTRCG